MSAWQPIETAPRDGTEVLLPLYDSLRAYWDEELKRWVLSKPLHMESVANPTQWKPLPEPPP